MDAAASALRNAMSAETGFGAGATRNAIHSIQRRAGGLSPETVVLVTGIIAFALLSLPPVWSMLNYITPNAVTIRKSSGGLGVVGYILMLLLYCFTVALALVASRACANRQRRRSRMEMREAVESRHAHK